MNKQDHRVRLADLFDAEVRAHNERFRAVADIGARDRVLDIGCGTGESTREAARAAIAGSAVGLDPSAPALELARRLTAAEGLRNVTYVQADAQAHQFPAASFDVCISRFGAMFFADPVAAFTNIGRALRPGARLVLLVWRSPDLNEWDTAITAALGGGTPATRTHFSLADQSTATRILTTAGFTDIGFTDVHEPVYYGQDAATAFDFVLGLRNTQELLAPLDPPAAEQARRRLRALLDDHTTGDGVFFDARTWIITATPTAVRPDPIRRRSSGDSGPG